MQRVSVQVLHVENPVTCSLEEVVNIESAAYCCGVHALMIAYISATIARQYRVGVIIIRLVTKGAYRPRRKDNPSIFREPQNNIRTT